MRPEMDARPSYAAWRWRAIILSRAAAAAMLLQWGCGTGNTTNSPPSCAVNGVAVSASPTTMNAGATAALTAIVNGSATCSGAVSWSATPAGGTLTPNALTATFTAVTVGTFTIRATSTDDATKSGAASVTVTVAAVPCGQPNGAVATHSANVAANETWAGDGVTHLVPSSIALTGSATVTIEPCAIVSLGQGVSITVRDNAQLVSAGTNITRFVVFRRNNASQAWGTLRGFHPTTLINLNWTRLEGGGAFGSMSDPTVAVAGPGYASLPVSVLHTNNVIIQSSQGVGVISMPMLPSTIPRPTCRSQAQASGQLPPR